MKARVLALATWFRDRMAERSTLAGVTTAIASAAVLPAPWCYASLLVGITVAFVPDGKIR